MMFDLLHAAASGTAVPWAAFPAACVGGDAWGGMRREGESGEEWNFVVATAALTCLVWVLVVHGS